MIVLDDRHGPTLARVSGSSSGRPDLTARQSSSKFTASIERLIVARALACRDGGGLGDAPLVRTRANVCRAPRSGQDEAHGRVDDGGVRVLDS